MKIVTLGEIAQIDRTVASVQECKTLPYVGLEHIEKDTGHFTVDFRLRPETLLATKFKFTANHVRYGKLRPYLNKVALPNFSGVCTTEILPILPLERVLDRGYLWAVLLSPEFVTWASSSVSGANLPRLDPKLLAEYKLPLPPLPEQRRIAAILAKADRLRRLRRFALELNGSYLQAVFLQMFGDPAANPMGWHRVQLKDITFDLRGGSPLEPTDFVERGFPVLHKGAIKPYGVVELDPNKKTFTHDGFVQKYKRAVVSRQYTAVTSRDLVPSGPSIGLMSQLKLSPYPEYILAQGAYAFLVDEEQVTPEYLVWLSNMPSFREILLSLSVGSTQIHIRTPVFMEMFIPLPSLDRQRKFARVVHQHERMRIQQHEAERQAEHLFQTLLHRTFRGELDKHALGSASGDIVCWADTDGKPPSRLAEVVQQNSLPFDDGLGG